eukprot:CAMPEP_0113936780 /NCGR_PEP_ID=MMETSP1339-20121228/3579_1 /TAXON_ID=94617 /ORGANISM="Fibrocapsa japonica" /LENGTH=307 /DNA_ID=CAMNT_0000939331 /DNA_START=77 /DNA_END=1000 /DNA_ORIENTATION=+ /assembly_acc=CAM_ASM_000762
MSKPSAIETKEVDHDNDGWIDASYAGFANTKRDHLDFSDPKHMIDDTFAFTNFKITKCEVYKYEDVEVILDNNKEPKRYTMYVIRCENEVGKRWMIFRRYSEFHSLHQHLEDVKRRYKDVREFKFPGKSKFTTMVEFTKERRKSTFQKYLNLLLDLTPVPKQVLAFLEPLDDDVKMAAAKNPQERGRSMSRARQEAPPSPTHIIVEHTFYDYRHFLWYGFPLPIAVTILYVVIVTLVCLISSSVNREGVLKCSIGLMIGFWIGYLICRYVIGWDHKHISTIKRKQTQRLTAPVTHTKQERLHALKLD